MDPTGIHSDRGKGTGEEEDRLAFHSLVSALKDLSKGQKEVQHVITKLALKPEQGQNNLLISPGDGGSTNNSGRHESTRIHNTPHIFNKPARPTMPQFLENATIGPIIPAKPSEPFGAYLQEYKDLGEEFHSAMSFSDFRNMKSKNQPINFNRGFGI